MSFALRRVRGALLRLVRRRALSTAIGAALVASAAWGHLSGHVAIWWVEGLTLVAYATGLALIWTGIVGPGPDWVDD